AVIETSLPVCALLISHDASENFVVERGHRTLFSREENGVAAACQHSSRIGRTTSRPTDYYYKRTSDEAAAEQRQQQPGTNAINVSCWGRTGYDHHRQWACWLYGSALHRQGPDEAAH
ncbi:unnamed protein product, partial [Ectocarpus sp. 12 AP-2014]